MDASLEASVPEVFATASEVLDVDVVALCRDGASAPAELTSTRWAQPAVLTCSVAAFRALEGRGERFVAVAGHSIGEYAALVCAGALDLADALRLVALRARVTEDASSASPGGMAAVMRVDRAVVEDACARSGASLAADNSAGQLVISGTTEAIERARALLDAGGALTRTLEVAGAFHSSVMQPAAGPLRDELHETTFSEPSIEMWSSTTSGPISEPEEIRRALVDQLTSPVLWRETIEGIADRHGSSFVDVGPGRVVGALAKRIVSGADVRSVADLLSVGGEA
jgi:[acyl-carrier-protein] S-malonyltransferase